MRHPLGFAILVCALTAAVAAGLVLGPAQITLEEVWAVTWRSSSHPPSAPER